MKKNALLIDAFSTLHVGNGALIENTYKLTRENVEGKVEILSIDPAPNKDRYPNVHEDIFKAYGGSATQKASFAISLGIFFSLEFINILLLKGRIKFPWSKEKRNLIRAIDDSDICISLSGETINDYYYPHMYLRLLIYWIAILKKKSFVIFPQSIGPVFRWRTRMLLRLMLGKSKFIIARDKSSFELAKNIWDGKPARILFCPDVAVTQNSSPLIFRGRRTQKKLLGLTVSDVPRDEMDVRVDYVKKILDAIELVFPKSEYEILLMPSNYAYKVISKDYTACAEAKNELEVRGYDASILENRIHYPDEFQGLQKSLDLFISTRMHVGILATSAGVPTFMINTQHKILSYMKNINMEEYVGELAAQESDWHRRLKKLVSEKQIIREKLIASNLVLRGEVEKTISQVFSSLRD